MCFILPGLLACSLFSQSVEMREVKELGEIDKIEIYRVALNGKSYLVRSIDNSEQIELITKYVATFSDDWRFEYPYPRDDVSISFYDGNKLKTHIMIGTPTSQENLTGKYFLGFFWGPTRFITETEFNELTKLLLID
jgi:hypothetical protein